MMKAIKILILEHDLNDLELLQYALKKSGLEYVSEEVQSRGAFESALAGFQPDIILSDFSLPSFDGFTAFKIKEQQRPETPFMIVSGTIGDENAVELIKNGVTDYVLKEKLYQIGPKISRALNEAQARTQKEIAEQQVREREEELQKIMNLSLDVIFTVDQQGKFVSVSPACKLVLDYLPEELIGRNVTDFILGEDREKTHRAFTGLQNGIDIINLENRYVRKSGTTGTLLWSVRWHSDATGYGVAKEITEIKKAEEKIKYSEKRFRALLQNSTDGLTLLAEDGTVIERSPAALKILELNPNELTGKFRLDLVHPDDLATIESACNDVKIHPQHILTVEYRFLMPDGNYKWLETTFHNQLYEPSVNAIVLNFRDITERKLAEIALIHSEEKYRSLFELSPLPMWVYDVETFRFLNVNEAAIRHYGFSKKEFRSMTIKDIRPEADIEMLTEMVKKNKQTGVFFQGVVTHKKKNEELIQVEIQSNMIDYEGKDARLVLARDISERINYITAIEEQNKKLREIAWLQSHVVRAPLARLMGLIPLLENYSGKEEKFSELTGHLMRSANELDDVIKGIIKETDSIGAGTVA